MSVEMARGREKKGKGERGPNLQEEGKTESVGPMKEQEWKDGERVTVGVEREVARRVKESDK